MSNDKSLALFGRLGFAITKTSEVFEEHELRYDHSTAADALWQAARYGSGSWPLEADASAS
jgi:hypothetical protein